ncbi:hypothetical protein ACFVAJ_17040 [Agromyces sp. NPDC057679]|uniref:hypothetical protein n=1 Tax=Agromyces sp. NPDC057679 TaxID=3346207 RepID=UPI0036723002
MKFYDRSGREVSREEGVALFGEDRVVAQDMCVAGYVSTVHLVLDHNHSGEGDPLIFETMVFDGEGTAGCWRYSTEDAAREEHTKVFKALLAGVDFRAEMYSPIA